MTDFGRTSLSHSKASVDSMYATRRDGRYSSTGNSPKRETTRTQKHSPNTSCEHGTSQKSVREKKQLRET